MLLARYAPGLAPRPIRADLDADPPLIAMSLSPGAPLGTRQVAEAQENAIAAALTRLHHAIPPPVLARAEQAPGSPHLLPGRIREMAYACKADLLDPLPRRAYQAALGWLDSGRGERAASGSGKPVFEPRATRTLPTTCGTGTAFTWWTSRHPGAATGPRSLPTSSSTSPCGLMRASTLKPSSTASTSTLESDARSRSCDGCSPPSGSCGCFPAAAPTSSIPLAPLNARQAASSTYSATTDGADGHPR
jgi:hypothetical protein